MDRFHFSLSLPHLLVSFLLEHLTSFSFILLIFFPSPFHYFRLCRPHFFNFLPCSLSSTLDSVFTLSLILFCLPLYSSQHPLSSGPHGAHEWKRYTSKLVREEDLTIVVQESNHSFEDVRISLSLSLSPSL